jgi:hypothetical protein
MHISDRRTEESENPSIAAGAVIAGLSFLTLIAVLAGAATAGWF